MKIYVENMICYADAAERMALLSLPAGRWNQTKRSGRESKTMSEPYTVQVEKIWYVLILLEDLYTTLYWPYAVIIWRRRFLNLLPLLYPCKD